MEAKGVSCTAPSYDNIHFIGAIVAHVVDRLLAVTPAYANRDVRASRLLKCAAAIGNRINIAAENDLQGSFLELLRLINSSRQTLNADHCKVILKVFRGFAAQWIGGRGEFSCQR